MQLAKGQAYVEQVLERVEGSSNNQNQSTTAPTEAPTPVMSVEDAMGSDPVMNALQMGLNAGRIRMMTERQLNLTGRPYQTTQALVEAVIDGQIHDESGEESLDTDRHIENQVTRLLLSVVSSVGSEQDEPCTSAKVPEPPRRSTSAPSSSSSTWQSTSAATTSSASKTSCSSKSESLEEENIRLKTARECKICMVEEVGVVFVPCGHLCESLSLLLLTE